MEAHTSNEEGGSVEGNIPVESGASSWVQTGVGQDEMAGAGDNTPIPNRTAAFFTQRPASPRPATPPSLQRLARELKELKSSGPSSKQRLEILHDQRRQLLSHVATAKSEFDRLEVRLGGERSIEGSQEILSRLQEFKELHEWARDKWRRLGDEVLEAEGEIAMPGSRGERVREV